LLQAVDIAKARDIVKLLAVAIFWLFSKGVVSAFGSLITKLMDK
jgi:hypothetical protein